MAEEDSPAKKRPRAADTQLISTGDFYEDDVMAWLSTGEEEAGSTDELSKLLDSPADSCSSVDPTAPAGTRVRFIAYPYSSPLIFQSSTAYVTINGNEESCGSSFSEGESSVMASVDTRGMVNLGCGLLGSGVAWGTSEKGTDGCDGFDWDWEECGLSEAEVASFLGEGLFDPIFNQGLELSCL